MRVLVTGGAGFIGSHQVDALVEEGHHVAVVDNLSTGNPSYVNPEARTYTVDITDRTALADVFARERPAIVSHHAAQTSVRVSMKSPAEDAMANVIGTVNLLDLSAAHGVERVLFASTCAVYSEPVRLPMDECHPIGPNSPYGASKYAAEEYVRLYSRVHRLHYTIFRYGNVYGPRQNPKGEAGVVAIFMGQLLAKERPTIFGDGTKTRDYIFVSDVVDANLLAIASKGADQTLNVAGGVEVSDFEIFEAVRQATAADVTPRYAAKRPGEADRVGLANDRAVKGLGWSPKVQLKAGVAKVLAHHLDA